MEEARGKRMARHALRKPGGFGRRDSMRESFWRSRSNDIDARARPRKRKPAMTASQMSPHATCVGTERPHGCAPRSIGSPCCLLHAADGALDQVAHERNLVGVELQRHCALERPACRPSHRFPAWRACRAQRSSTIFQPQRPWRDSVDRDPNVARYFAADSFIAEATFISGKSHTLRSRTFSK